MVRSLLFLSQRQKLDELDELNKLRDITDPST
jgi:hypothetical protein